MADFSTDRVEEFVLKVKELEDEGQVQVWTKLCGWNESTTLPGFLGELTIEFFSLSPWNQQGVLHLLVPVIANAARHAARKSSRKARVVDPL